jgi:SNF2 family DNA or RNA helicase
MAPPGFQVYIVTLRYAKEGRHLFQYVPDIKTIIIDECQRIKNHLSDRAKAVQRICKKTEYHIPMSGTPIKNNAGEYFTVLNIVAPHKFPNWQRYVDDYCDSYDSGWGTKVGGLRQPQRFHDATSNIIIRRTKDQVLKDLPSLDRKFYHVDLDPKLNKAYAAALKELDDLFYSDESGFARTTAEIAIMAKMRHITGISKIETCVEWTTEFLMSCERKLTIFTHHQDVAQLLEAKLNDWLKDGGFPPVLMMHSGLNGDQRAQLAKDFKDTPARIMIASTLAAGEGLNLQFCADAVMLERQWNPANEEQAEARFHRFGQENNVSVTYMLASGTIDEYFTELVEQKRSIVAGTLDNKEVPWDQQSLMKELTSMLVTKGRDKWRL